MCYLTRHVYEGEIKVEAVPGDLSDGRLVQADGRGEVWLRGVNRRTGHVLVIACPALLNLRERQRKTVGQGSFIPKAAPAQKCRHMTRIKYIR